ncbi:MAG TPA: hypothetical protein V6C69_03225 [Trichormus sp.]|jgi:hypothetical protein
MILASNINENVQLGSFHKWLIELPEESLHRLRLINMSTRSSRHVILSLTFGIYDCHIRKVNRMITHLLIARLKAERAGRLRLVARINQFMQTVHEAIDLATGVAAVEVARGSPCNRVRQANKAR